jgi:hypothetical protein
VLCFPGDHGGYNFNGHHPSSASSLTYSTLPHPHSSSGLIVEAVPPYVGTFRHHHNQPPHVYNGHVHFPIELDLEMSHTPPPPPPPMNGPSHLHLMPNNRHSMMVVPTSYGPLEDPTTLLTVQPGVSPPVSGPNDGPLCASSPKRSMSAFTTFGQRGGGSNSSAGTPLSPTPKPGPVPTTGHLV